MTHDVHISVIPKINKETKSTLLNREEKEVVATKEILKTYKVYQKLLLSQKKIKKQIETHKNKIINFLKKDEADKILLNADRIKIGALRLITAKKFDNQAFKNDYSDLYSEYLINHSYFKYINS